MLRQSPIVCLRHSLKRGPMAPKIQAIADQYLSDFSILELVMGNSE